MEQSGKKEYSRLLLTAIAGVVAGTVAGYALCWVFGSALSRSNAHEGAPTEQVSHVADTLSEWQVVQLAIALTESRCNPDAVGASQDLGLLQITPIYAREASRLNKDKDYAHEDAFDPSKAVGMFNVVQGHYNPTHDTDKAIRLHNPGGASIGYPAKVKENMQFIKRMETARRAVLVYD